MRRAGETIGSYEEAVRAFDGIARFSGTASLQPVRENLQRLGSPEKHAGLILHVAGTNGKGSVCAYLASMLREAGLKTGCFTSPHLVRMNERIQVDGQPIPDGAFLSAFRAVRRLEEEGERPFTYFEYLFYMGMCYFASVHTEAAVIETGLGGRLDPTNAIDGKAAAVITSISFDHMGILGSTIREIAAEKAGILRPGVPCIYDASNREAAAVIEERAGALGLCSGDEGGLLFPLRASDYAIHSCRGGVIDFSTAFRYDRNTDYRIRSAAPYQAANASLAVLTVKALARAGLIRPTAGEVRAGLLAMRWPARMEEIRPRVYLDGAHNEDGIRKFLEAVRSAAGGKRAVLLFSAVTDKAYGDMIEMLAAGFPWQRVLVTEIGGERRTGSGRLKALFENAGVREVLSFPDARSALLKALAEQREDEYIFIAGSLYLAGEVRRVLLEGAGDLL